VSAWPPARGYGKCDLVTSGQEWNLQQMLEVMKYHHQSERSAQF